MFIIDYLGCFQVGQVGAMTSKAAINIHIQVYVWPYIFISLGIDGSYRKDMFNFTRNFQTVFQRGSQDFYKDDTKSKTGSPDSTQKLNPSKVFEDEEENAEM